MTACSPTHAREVPIIRGSEKKVVAGVGMNHSENSNGKRTELVAQGNVLLAESEGLE